MDLDQAREEYLTGALENPQGGMCPCCLRVGKARRRSINPDQAFALIQFWLEYGQEWGDFQVVRRKHPGLDGREESKLVYWRLIEKKGGTRNTFRVTDYGVAWLLRETTVPKYAYAMPGGEVVNYSIEKHVSIVETLEKKYDYETVLGLATVAV